MIGKSSRENLVNDGAFASVGRSDNIAFTLRCAPCRAISTFASLFNSIVTVDKLSEDLEMIFLIFSMDATASSIFLVIVLSTSLGEAPGYTVAIVTTGDVNFGSNS